MSEARSDRLQYLAEQAIRRARRGFYIHLFVYLAVITGLVVINYLTGGPWWVQWPLIGWGIGILFHGYTVLARTNRATQAVPPSDAPPPA